MQDSAIIGLFFRREEAAVSETQKKYGGYCYRIAHNILDSHEDSEECVADTLMRAWNVIPPQKPHQLKLFLAKITRNLAFDRRRSQARQKRGGGNVDAVLSELETCIAVPGDAADELEYRELQRVIAEFVESLPEREQNLFLRRYFYTESVSGIAKKFHLTPNNVSVILSRTRAGLRDRLIREGFFL